MNGNSAIFKGTIFGKHIELDRAPGLPDGESVTVVVRTNRLASEGLRRAFGAWADDAFELDDFLEQIRHDRKQVRRNSVE